MHAGSPVQQISYTYDTVGNRTAKTVDTLQEAYSYDALSRLTGVARAGATPRRWRFGYDSVGNRVSDQTDGIALSGDFDTNNQLQSLTPGGKMHIVGEVDESATVSVAGQPARMTGARTFEADVDVTPGTNSLSIVSTDGSGNSRTQLYEVEVGGDAATFEYDENGNTTQKVSGGHTWTYQWNALNQLTAVSKDGQPAATFKYDALGRRIEKVAGGLTYRFAYSGQDILRETQSTGTTYTYLHGPGIDEPLARMDQSGAVAYYHADGLGSIVAMTDAAGNVTSRRQYDAWGNLEVGADQPGYAFTGREWDPETGLYYYRARYYDPKTGRFTGEDPIGFDGGVNFYAYASGNPPTAVDPSGTAVAIAGPNGRPLTARDLGAPAPPGPDASRTEVAFYVLQYILWSLNPGGLMPGPAIIGMPGPACGSSRALGKALEAAGRARKAGEAAHHIVAGGAEAAAPARAVLERFGVGINDAANGVFLPADYAAAEGADAAAHAGVHTRAYYAAVNEMLAQATSRPEVVETLAMIRVALPTSRFP